MLRIEILKRAKELDERVHLLTGALTTSFVLTYFTGEWTHHGAENWFVEILHSILLVVDLVGFLLFVSILLFRAFGLSKPSRTLLRLIHDKQCNEKIKDWFAAESGERTPRKVRFCTEEDIEALVELNYEAFKDTVFAVEKEKLVRRNLSWIERNPRIFQLILDPFDPCRHVGYSAMLPLTAEGMASYLDGALKDADIPASLVARGSATTAGVLIFAIHLRDAYSFQKSQASRNYSLYFLACVRYHAQALFPRTRKKCPPYAPIYVQTEHKAMLKRLSNYGFLPTGKRSADGFEILVLQRPFRDMPARLASPKTPQFLSIEAGSAASQSEGAD